MTEPKFTPGPWRKSFTTVDCGRGRYINQIWWKHKDVAEAEANAALIAAAPEMYTELARIEDILEDSEDCGEISLDRIKTVLRKARGESEASE